MVDCSSRIDQYTSWNVLITKFTSDMEMTNEILEDFEKTFSKEILEQVLDHAYEHGDLSSAAVPKDKTQKLFFSLLKMIDFECFAYDHAPEGLLQTDVMTWLRKYKDEIKCEPPSMLGMFAGSFNFLLEKQK